MPRTPTTTAATRFVAASRPSPRPCRIIPSVRSCSLAVLRLSAISLVIPRCAIAHPGCACWRRPGIHTHDRGYGFSDVQLHIKARRYAPPRNDSFYLVKLPGGTSAARPTLPGGRGTLLVGGRATAAMALLGRRAPETA